MNLTAFALSALAVAAWHQACFSVFDPVAIYMLAHMSTSNTCIGLWCRCAICCVIDMAPGYGLVLSMLVCHLVICACMHAQLLSCYCSQSQSQHGLLIEGCFYMKYKQIEPAKRSQHHTVLLSDGTASASSVLQGVAQTAAPAARGTQTQSLTFALTLCWQPMGLL